MPLDMVIEQQDGKPDRKYYTLRDDVLYTHNIAKMDVYFLLGYKRSDLISQKIDYINDESERLAKMPLSLIGQMRIDSNNLAPTLLSYSYAGGYKCLVHKKALLSATSENS